jgi:hypothetical protein
MSASGSKADKARMSAHDPKRSAKLWNSEELPMRCSVQSRDKVELGRCALPAPHAQNRNDSHLLLWPFEINQKFGRSDL